MEAKYRQLLRLIEYWFERLATEPTFGRRLRRC
jgi:hypothetical protein